MKSRYYFKETLQTFFYAFVVTKMFFFPPNKQKPKHSAATREKFNLNKRKVATKRNVQFELIRGFCRNVLS